MEAVKVINKDTCLAEPLTIKLAPKSLCPTCVGNRQVKSFRIYAVPIVCRYEMAERIFKVMGCDFRISCCARSEKHKHLIVAACAFLGAFKLLAEKLNLIIEVVPAPPRLAYDNLRFERR